MRPQPQPQPQPQVLVPPDVQFASARGAGIIFTDGSVILCGWEPRKRRGRGGIYGIGGKTEAGDHGDYRLTAAREMLEELFGLHSPVPYQLVLAIAALPVVHTEIIDSYVIIQHSFATLGLIMGLVRKETVSVPLYPRGAPQTLEALLLERQWQDSTEFAQLCILPVVSTRLHISSELVDDIRRLAKQRTPLENGQQLQPSGTTSSASTDSPCSIDSATAAACTND